MANGNFGGGTGHKDTPFLVEDADDLNAVRDNLTFSYEQVADIDMSSYADFVPIGGDGNSFKGFYSGGNYSITNLKINDSSFVTGLFGFVSAGGVVFTHLKSADISGAGWVGGIVGYISGDSTIIESCSVFGSVKSNSTSDYAVGGVVGKISGSSISRLQFSGDVLGENTYAGGVVGIIEARISLYDSFSTGTVLGKTAGGVVGQINNSCFARRCYSSSVVKGYDAAGGIAGEAIGNNSKGTTYCFALNPEITRLDASSNSSRFGDLYGYGQYTPTTVGCHSIDTMEIVL